MIIIDITSNALINDFASIFINLTFVTAPLFGAISLLKN